MGDRKPVCRHRRKSFPFGILATLILLGLAAMPSAHAQAAGEYAGATGVSASAVTSKPMIMSRGSHGSSNGVTLASPSGPSPQKINRGWFAKQAGKKGAQLSIDAVPPGSRVWIDGKYVGQAPLTVTLPAGKHHLSLMGARQEHADRDVEIASGKNRHLEIHLQQTYPRAVSITVFGNQPH
ncbi:MAG TPA: PEGA domain-containing protein [Patescibacteria group bacterium]|nr:PEGA domain-containing protein [Patescibacteria group bacterium]